MRAWDEAAAAMADGSPGAVVELLDRALATLGDSTYGKAPAWRAFWRNTAIQLEIDLQRFRSAQRRITELLDSLDDPDNGLSERDRARARAFAFGQRGEVYRRWGLEQPAAHWFEREALLVDACAAEDEASVLNEWLASGEHRALLIAMRHESESIRELESFVASRLADPRMDAALPRARLRRILGIALADAAADDPALADRADRILREVLDELPPDHSAGRVLPGTELAELALARDDPDEARRLLAVAREHVDASTEGEAGREALVIAEARLALATGAGDAELRDRDAALTAAWEAFLERWAALEPREGGYGPLHYAHVRALLVERTRIAAALDGGPAAAELALRLVDRAQSLGRLARGAPPAPASLATTLRDVLRLGPRSGLLVLVPGPRISILVALDDAAPTVVELPAKDTLQRAIDAASATWMAGRRSPDEGSASPAALRALAGHLLPSSLADRTGRWDALTVVGDTLLLELAFEALPARGGSAGTAWAISHLPSLPFARARAARTAPVAPRTAWIASAPPVPAAALALAPDLAPLSLEPEDAARIVRPYDEAHVLHGPEVSVDTLSAAPLERVGVLQFLGHGAYDLLAERPATLVVAATAEHDGLLRAADIVERIRPPPVVVLTACRTGRGPLRAGDQGAADLAGAFLEAGARVVVTSPYDLDVEAARRLSTAFHRGLERGETAAEALRAAREELLRDARFDDPVHHAVLRVVGLGNEASWPAPWWRGPVGLVVGAVALAASAAVVLAARRRASPRV